MKRKRVFGWTPLSTWLSGTVVCTTAAGFTVGIEPTSARLPLLAIVALALVCALAVDEYAGLVLAVVAAAGVVIVKQTFGDWQSTSFIHATALAASTIVAVWSMSIVATRLRKNHHGEPARDDLPDPHAVIRVEWERATAHDRPLTLLVIGLKPVDDRGSQAPYPESDDVARAEGEVSRMLSAIAAPTDIPSPSATTRSDCCSSRSRAVTPSRLSPTSAQSSPGPR